MACPFIMWNQIALCNLAGRLICNAVPNDLLANESTITCNGRSTRGAATLPAGSILSTILDRPDVGDGASLFAGDM